MISEGQTTETRLCLRAIMINEFLKTVYG